MFKSSPDHINTYYSATYLLALARLVEVQGVRIHEKIRVSGYPETADGMTVLLASGARAVRSGGVGGQRLPR